MFSLCHFVCSLKFLISPQYSLINILLVYKPGYYILRFSKDFTWFLLHCCILSALSSGVHIASVLREAFDTNLWSAIEEMSGDTSIKPLKAFSYKNFFFFSFVFFASICIMNESASSGNGQEFDVFSAMDWKDGIGTLPGSDLKVRYIIFLISKVKML